MDSAPELLGMGDAGGHPVGNLLGEVIRPLDTGFGDDVGAGDLGVLLVIPDADDADVVNVLAADELGFQLCGRDLETLCRVIA